MLKDHSIRSYLKYSVAAAILYCAAVWIFIYDETFSASYILYIGNILFGCCIAVFIWLYNKNKAENAKVGKMIMAGHITTIMGIIIACLISLLLLLLYSSKQPADVLANSPAQLHGKNHGFFLVLFINAIIGNICTGSFVSVVLSATIKRNQESKPDRNDNNNQADSVS